MAPADAYIEVSIAILAFIYLLTYRAVLLLLLLLLLEAPPTHLHSYPSSPLVICYFLHRQIHGLT